MKHDNLALGIIVLTMGTLIAIGLFLTAQTPYMEKTAPVLPFVLIAILAFFMYMFGWLPLRIYFDDRKSERGGRKA